MRYSLTYRYSQFAHLNAALRFVFTYTYILQQYVNFYFEEMAYLACYFYFICLAMRPPSIVDTILQSSRRWELGGISQEAILCPIKDLKEIMVTNFV